MPAELSAKEEAVADFYAAGLQPAQIAAQTGFGLTTVYRLLRKPLIRARIAEARAVKLRPILELVYGEMAENVKTLREIRASELTQPRDKIAAVQEFNRMAERFGDIAERSGHVAHLEACVADLTPGAAPPVADELAGE